MGRQWLQAKREVAGLKKGAMIGKLVKEIMVASKLGVKVAHVEAGLRSFDRSMPEEINRIVTDAVAELLWTPSEDGNRNLLREGVPTERIECVGNIMIDCFELHREAIAGAKTGARRRERRPTSSRTISTTRHPISRSPIASSNWRRAAA